VVFIYNIEIDSYMKQKILLLMLLVFAGTEASQIIAQSLIIRSVGGTEDTRSLGSLQKFSFSATNLILTSVSGSTEAFSLSAISKLYFADVPIVSGITTQYENAGNLLLYPNPAENIICLQNLPEGNFFVTIYRMDGVMVLKAQISSGEDVDISMLEEGLYLLNVNDQTTRFIKR
jgi:hypothetical protein